MDRRSRVMGRVLVTLLGAAVGAVLMSGSDQPVTAHAYPRWQELAAPPLAPRSDALGVRVGHRVLVLGGVGSHGVALRDGASYDLRTGTWRRVVTPVATTTRDVAVAAAGVAVLRHARYRADGRVVAVRPSVATCGRGCTRYLRSASAPSAFRSEVYAVAGRHVEVYSVQLGRWTPLPADPVRPRLTHGRVRASLHGTIVTGYAGESRSLVADRWDGLSWHRVPRLAAGPTTGSGSCPAAYPPAEPRGSPSEPGFWWWPPAGRGSILREAADRTGAAPSTFLR